jgi:hypothetical protein
MKETTCTGCIGIKLPGRLNRFHTLLSAKETELVGPRSSIVKPQDHVITASLLLPSAAHQHLHTT